MWQAFSLHVFFWRGSGAGAGLAAPNLALAPSIRRVSLSGSLDGTALGISVMAYRRSQNDGVFSSRWRIKHQPELVGCGILSGIAGDDRRWTYVLLHGDDLESGWSESWLSEEQARKLLALLEPQFSEPIGIGLVEALRRRGSGGG
jgi:hypothetical protein